MASPRNSLNLMLKRRLIFASLVLAVASPAPAQGPPIRKAWRDAAQVACRGGTPFVDPNSLDQEVCTVTCKPGNSSEQKLTTARLPNGAPCHKHHMAMPPFPLHLGTCSNGYCNTPNQ